MANRQRKRYVGARLSDARLATLLTRARTAIYVWDAVSGVYLSLNDLLAERDRRELRVAKD